MIGALDHRSSTAGQLGQVRNFRAPGSQIQSLLATVTAYFQYLPAIAIFTILASVANDIGTAVATGAGRLPSHRAGGLGQAFPNSYRLRRYQPLSKSGSRGREAPTLAPPVTLRLQFIGKAATYAGLYLIKFSHQGARPQDWMMFTDQTIDEETTRAADFTWLGVHPDLVGLSPDRIITLELVREERYSWDSVNRSSPSHYITGMVVEAN